MKKKLSEKQESILEYIGDFLDDNRYPPTVRDIQYGCGISSTSVVDYNLRILQREGFINRQSDVSRGIELVGHTSRNESFTTVPVYGSIAAGEPLHIPGAGTDRLDPDESLELPAFLTGGQSDAFAVRVKGESMIDALVADGDLVVMVPTASARNGEMVAAEIIDREEVTLKHFFMHNGQVILEPANSQMEPQVYPAENVSIRGKVVGVIRSI